MDRYDHSLAVLSAGFMLVAAASVVQARVITDFTLPGNPATPVVTPQPNNNNTVAASPNVIAIPEITLNSLAPLDIVLSVEASGGNTEYFVTSSFRNQTGVDWTGFRFQLGIGTGDDFRTPEIAIPEVQAPNFDVFTMDPAPTSGSFSNLVLHQSALLAWSNGLVSHGSDAVPFTFSLDYNDDLIPSNLTAITLRQVPVPVPEPAAALLAALGGAGMALAVARRNTK